VNAEDPLQALVIDAADVDRQRIADALRGVIAIDKTGQVIPLPGFQDLGAAQKIQAFLLGRKVAVLLDMAEEEAIGPKQLAAQSGVAEGTIYPTVRQLHGSRLISQDVDSAYYLSPHQVTTAIQELAHSADDEGVAGAGGAHAGRKTTATRPSKPAKRRRSTQRAASSNTESTPPRKRTSAGFSTTDTIRDLLSDGFFDSPKGLADVQRWLKDKKGRDIPVTTLSPTFTRMLRDGSLDRQKNDAGAYEYVRAVDE
jgi:hypothetical protein